MPVLLNCHNIRKSFGSRLLFDRLSLTLSDGERLGLIGPNGSGKSTLLSILAGLQEPDEGTRSIRKLARVVYVPQDSLFPEEASVRSVLEEAMKGLAIDDAEKSARLQTTLGRAALADPEARTSTLSGGQRKRLAIASGLVEAPDALLLDEPTNHLDLDGILWLEKLLIGSAAASIVVSHDRYFLENVATHMAEVSAAYPDGIFLVKGGYSEFLERREEFLEAQSKQQEALATKVRREVEWLRRGPKARTGKSRARIDAAGRLIEELADVTARNTTTRTRIDFTASDRKTKRLLVAEGIAKSYGERVLFRELDLVLSPGMRLGLVGGNGSGKTTLLKILQGEVAPDQGTVERADVLRMVSFEQHRDTLEPALSLRRALCPDGDSVIFRGRPTHVAGWAKRFQFRNEQLEMPVGSLSGGERARVYIAKLMLEPADVLLLDEPTNDLDIPTLEVLEDNLLDFPGALVLVTHDRYLLDRVSTVVLGLDGDGDCGIYADYSQWELARQAKRPTRPAGKEPAPSRTPPPKKKLSYLEQREWEGMEERILAAESVLEERQMSIQDPNVVSDGMLLQRKYEELQEAQHEVERLYARWAELESKLGERVNPAG